MNAAFVFLTGMLVQYSEWFTPPDVAMEDLERFPPPYVVAANLEFIRLHREWLDNQHGLNQADADYWIWRRRDMGWRWDVWDDLRLAHLYRGETRLCILRRLRDKIGWELYTAGLMPNYCLIEEFYVYGD